jgi:hypothetical protein
MFQEGISDVFLNFDGVDPDQHQVFLENIKSCRSASLVQLNDRKAQLSLDGTKMNAGVIRFFKA